MNRTPELPELPDGFSWRLNGSAAWISWALGGAQAAFTTRLGGVSDGPFESLNLGFLTGDDRGRVLENRERAAAAVGLDPRRVAIGRQVHGTDLAVHRAPPRRAHYGGEAGEAEEVDGHLIEDDGAAGLVFVADCLPIVIAGRAGAGVLHGGWRGLAGGIIGAAASRIGAEAMAVGPGIGPCCYEVGDEVLARFSGLGPGVVNGRMLDLAAAAAALAHRAGIGEVYVSGLCTKCNPELFFSHRGTGPVTGRQAGIGWIETVADRG